MWRRHRRFQHDDGRRLPLPSALAVVLGGPPRRDPPEYPKHLPPRLDPREEDGRGDGERQQQRQERGEVPLRPDGRRVAEALPVAETCAENAWGIALAISSETIFC